MSVLNQVNTTTNTEKATAIFTKLMGIPVPPQLVITNGVQQMVPVGTWADVFTHIRSQHFHATSKCTCPHSESLYDHLCACGLICFEQAIKADYAAKECLMAYLTGLLHDIGKPGTLRQLAKRLAFKGHGIVGGAMLENFYSPELETQFGLTKEDWGAICACASVHMCSYFEGQTTPLHKFSVNVLPHNVKRLLAVLRTGDQLSMIPIPSYTYNQTQIEQIVLTGQKEYLETLFDPMEFQSLGLKKGVLVFIQGTSASGKSSMARRLIKRFGPYCVWVNRDLEMVRQVMKTRGLTPIQTIEEMTPALYQQCHQYYLDSNKKCAPQINNAMRLAISEGLQHGNIVIVDTMATMHDAIEGIIPDNAANAYRISFWMHRNQLITEEETTGRLGMSLESQVKVHGDKTIWNPLPQNINWFNMISATESADLGGDSKTQSHLAISVGWTGIMDSVLNHLFDQMELMYKYNQTIPRVPVLNQTTDLTLIELVQKLNDIDGLNSIVEFFTQYGYVVYRSYPGTVGIKYLDGINQIWQPRWSREARGPFFSIGSGPGSKVMYIKRALQRGIEVLTKTHTESGINATQDVCSKAWDIFDPVQQQVLKALSGSNPFIAKLTCKVDGSLLIGNIYPKGCEQYPIIKELALGADEFTRTLVSYCIDNDLDLVTIATQGTLFIGSDMQDYFITSIQPLISGTIQTMADWAWVGPQFARILIDYYQGLNLPSQRMVSFCFEAYCKNRTTITGRVHKELAVSYNESGLNLLGMTLDNQDNQYVPHFDMQRRVFKQPAHCHVTHTDQVFELMKELDQVVMGTRTIDDFLKHFVLDEFTSTIIHAEGFVLLTPQPTGLYDYAKIKTDTYYRCHKVRKDNIPDLLNQPISCDNYYPILSKMRAFFNDMGGKINRLVAESFRTFTQQINQSSQLYQLQNVKGRGRWDQVIGSIDLTNPSQVIGNKLVEVVFRMMLNTNDSVDEVTRLLSPITRELYQTESTDIIIFTKDMLMKVEPWKPNWESRLNQMISAHDESINQLYGIVVGFTD